MSLIVDASVAARWFVPVLAWPSAAAVLQEGRPLIAPELILAETANAFWKAVRAGYAVARSRKRRRRDRYSRKSSCVRLLLHSYCAPLRSTACNGGQAPSFSGTILVRR